MRLLAAEFVTKPFTSDVVPAGRPEMDLDASVEMQPPGFAMAHHVRPGHRLVLRATTSDPDTLEFRRLAPGTYRLEVHNWAGAPGNAVNVRLTFFDSTGHAP